MLNRAEPPICVGLYARWGSGKTFMISLLKKEFDPTVHEDKHTRQLLQFFQKGYKKPEPEQAETENVGSLICGLLLTILLTFMPTMSYGVTTFLSIICDAFDPREALYAAWAWCSSLRRSCAKTGPSDASYQSVQNDGDEQLVNQHEAKKSGSFWQPLTGLFREQKKEVKTEQKRHLEKEFIFVDFNAWEYAASVHTLCIC